MTMDGKGLGGGPGGLDVSSQQSMIIGGVGGVFNQNMYIGAGMLMENQSQANLNRSQYMSDEDLQGFQAFNNNRIDRNSFMLNTQSRLAIQNSNKLGPLILNNHKNQQSMKMFQEGTDMQIEGVAGAGGSMVMTQRSQQVLDA